MRQKVTFNLWAIMEGIRKRQISSKESTSDRKSDGSLDQGGCGEWAKQWEDSVCILKVKTVDLLLNWLLGM